MSEPKPEYRAGEDAPPAPGWHYPPEKPPDTTGAYLVAEADGTGAARVGEALWDAGVFHVHGRPVAAWLGWMPLPEFVPPGQPTVSACSCYPCEMLAAVWDNPQDAVYDRV